MNSYGNRYNVNVVTSTQTTQQHAQNRRQTPNQALKTKTGIKSHVLTFRQKTPFKIGCYGC